MHTVTYSWGLNGNFESIPLLKKYTPSVLTGPGKVPPEVQPWEDRPNLALGLERLLSEESVLRA